MDDDTLLLDAPASSPIAAQFAPGVAPSGARPLTADPCTALRERCHTLRTRLGRLRLSIALSAARFVDCQGPGWMCCSSRADYAREHLGMPAATFGAYVRAGRLLHHLPAAACAMADGRLGWSALRELTALPTPEHAQPLLEEACGKTAREVRALVSQAFASLHAQPHPQAHPAETRDSPPDLPSDSERRAAVLQPLEQAEYQPLTLHLPPEVAAYAHDTLELARAVVGIDGPDDVALDAVVAEAAERIPITVSAQDACRRLGLHQPPPPDATPNCGDAMPAPCHPRLRSLGQARVGGPSAVRHLDPCHPTRRDAHRLDRWLRRQTALLQRAQVQMQDQLLQLLLDDAPHRLGYPSMAAMAEALLHLPEATTWDYIRRARRRRRDHPIAIARATGRLTDVKADLLETLQAQAHVPTSALNQWIDRADSITVRKLRDMLAWARRQTYADARAWANSGYVPPDDHQLRTSSRLVEDIARDPTPPDPVPLLVQADAVRTVKVRWVLQTTTLVALAQVITSLQDSIQRQHERTTGEPCPRPTVWWAVLGVMVMARRAWAPLATQTDYDSHPTLKRDNFRCAAPGCTQRRDLQEHHLHYRGRGGDNQRSNRASLCAFHHQLGEHGGILRVRGQAIPDATALRWRLALDLAGRPTRITHGDDIVHDARRWRPHTSIAG